jgi:hypothetical protein
VLSSGKDGSEHPLSCPDIIDLSQASSKCSHCPVDFPEDNCTISICIGRASQLQTTEFALRLSREQCSEYVQSPQNHWNCQRNSLDAQLLGTNPGTKQSWPLRESKPVSPPSSRYHPPHDHTSTKHILHLDWCLLLLTSQSMPQLHQIRNHTESQATNHPR